MRVSWWLSAPWIRICVQGKKRATVDDTCAGQIRKPRVRHDLAVFSQTLLTKFQEPDLDPQVISDRPGLSRQRRAEPQVDLRQPIGDVYQADQQPRGPGLVSPGKAGRRRWVEYESLDVVGPVFPCRCSTRSYSDRVGWCDWA